MLTLAAMLQQVIQVGGSDLHLTPGTPPQIRVDGELRPLGSPPLTAADTERLASSLHENGPGARVQIAGHSCLLGTHRGRAVLERDAKNAERCGAHFHRIFAGNRHAAVPA
jgi:hypothetical protein